MFTKGEYVVYEQKGVCCVEGFEAPDIPGIAKDRTYYVLLPVLQGGNYMFLRILPKVRCGRSFPGRKPKN